MKTEELLTLISLLNKAERSMIPESAIVCSKRKIELWRLDVLRMKYLLSLVDSLELIFSPKEVCKDSKEFY